MTRTQNISRQENDVASICHREWYTVTENGILSRIGNDNTGTPSRLNVAKNRNKQTENNNNALPLCVNKLLKPTLHSIEMNLLYSFRLCE